MLTCLGMSAEPREKVFRFPAIRARISNPFSQPYASRMTSTMTCAVPLWRGSAAATSPKKAGSARSAQVFGSGRRSRARSGLFQRMPKPLSAVPNHWSFGS